MTKGPCLGCKERTITCHSECQKYNDWVAEKDKVKELVRAEKTREKMPFTQKREKEYFKRMGNK